MESQTSTQEAPSVTPTESAPSTEQAAPSPETEGKQETQSTEAAPAEREVIEQVSDATINDPIFQQESDYKGVNYQEVVGALPDDAKKLVHNLRSSFTRKTQELAEDRKSLAAARSALDAQRATLIESSFFKDVSEKAEQKVENFDPYDNKSVEARIKQEVAIRMKEMLEPIRQANETQQRQSRLDSFKSDHPDLEGMKGDVAKVLMANEHLNLEQAYWQVKGQQLHKQEQTQSAELKQYKSAAKAAGLKVGGASRGRGSGVPQYVLDQDDPVAIYNWLKSNKAR